MPVTIYDPSASVLSSAVQKFDTLLQKDVSKARISQEDADAARQRFNGVRGDGTEGERIAEDTDIVIEVRCMVTSPELD